MPFDNYSDTVINNASIKNNLRPDNSDIKTLINAHGIYNRRDMDWYSKFTRVPIIDPYNTMTVTREYLFFTKPDLHLINTSTGAVAKSLNKYSFFVDAVNRYRPVCEQLQNSATQAPNRFSTLKTPFATILSNAVRSGLDTPSIELDGELETGVNVYGTKISYRGNSYNSDQDKSFSLEFEDTKYLEIYMFFKIYDEYCRLKSMGMIELDPNDSDDTRWVNYTINKVLHDQFSVYKFVVGEDGMTLIYWCKYTGIYPDGAPRDAFSDMSNEDGQRLTVNFKAQFFKDMDPSILSEFNTIAMTSNFNSRAELPIFNEDICRFDGRWSSMPHIQTVSYRSPTQLDKMMQYRLAWKI